MVGARVARLLNSGAVDPWSFLEDLQSELAGVFLPSGAPRNLRVWTSEHAAQVEIDAPGIDPAGCEIAVQDQLVTLTVPAPAASLPDGARVHRAERPRDGFTQRLRLPFSADGVRTEAVYDRGVLRLTLHRREETKPQKISIKAG